MESPFNFNDIVLVLAMAGCFLITVLSQLVPTRRKLASKLLSIFFICLFFHLFGLELFWNPELSDLRDHISPVIIILTVTPSLLIGPVQLFYLHAFVSNGFALNKRHWAQISIALILPTFLLFVGVDSVDLLPNFSTSQENFVVNGLWAVLKMYPLMYSALCIRILLRNTKYSDLDKHSDFRIGLWLFMLVLGGGVYWAWMLLVHILGQYQYLDMPILNLLGAVGNYICFGLILVLLTMTLAYALRMTRLNLHHVNSNKSSSVRIPPDCIERIESVISSQKLYKNKSLTLDVFAEAVGYPPKVVSNAIKQAFQQNFNQFINKYRVIEAKSMFDSVEYRDSTISEIFYKAGFNSKSAFQRIFRESTGVSPTEYRQQVSNSH